MSTATMDAPTMAAPGITQQAATLAAKTICLVVRRGRFGNSKTASMSDVQVAADKSLLRLSKTLLDSPELRLIQQFDGETDRWVKQRAFNSMFKGGVHLIAVGQVEDVDTYMAERAAARKQLVLKFGEVVETDQGPLTVYELRTQETSARLGVVHNPSDYPSQERFTNAFTFEWRWVTFETPTRLASISKAIFEKEKLKAQEKLSSVAASCEQAMRAGMSKLVDHLVERLSPGEDGKAKRFTKNSVNNFQEFLATFELRNVTNDSELSALVKKARALMNGVDPAVLQKDELVRAKVHGELEQLSAALDPLIVEKGTRAISFEDDEYGGLV